MDNKIDNLIMHLESAGSALVNKTTNGIKPLRDLKDDILPYYLHKEFPAEVRCCSFLLVTFFDDIFYNMAGDFPQEEPYGEAVDDIRREFFNNVGSGLARLGQALERKDVKPIFNEFSALVTAYLDSLDKINEEIEGAVHGI